MENEKKYRELFVEILGVSDDELDDLEYMGVSGWDSLGHMNLIAGIEEAFDIMMDTDDIIDFSSFKKGKEILAKYDIEF